MCFSVTSGSPCPRQGSQPGHIKHSGCETGRGCAGMTNLLCLCCRPQLPLHTVHGHDANLGPWIPNWLEMPITSPICFMWFNEQPRLQLASGRPHRVFGRGCPTQRYPCSLAELLFPEAAATWWHVGAIVESTKQHPPHHQAPSC